MDLSGRLYGEYRCDSCRKKWTSLDATEAYQECHTCEENAERIVVRPLKYSDIPFNRRLYGKFQCSKCKKQWQSANSWKGYKQKCKSCKVFAGPYYLNFLEFQGDSGDKEKPHRQDLCEKCIKLGHKCRQSVDVDDLEELMEDMYLY